LATGDRPVRVAVDAMGGDHAPAEIVAGAIEAARQGGIQVMLVGDIERLQSELAKHDISRLPLATIPSEGVLVEGEPPALALRQKPRASILVATSMVKQGHADASVTMGSTGGAMAAAAVVLGMAEGIERPAIGGPILGIAPHTCIIDVGTNVDCRPHQLLSFAVIGDVFARQFWSIERPRVAILSVGAEAGKGNRLVRETTELLVKSGLNFIGNVEANEIPRNKAEVIVCDGFVGNVIMKLTEGLGQAVSDHLRSRLQDKLDASDLDPLVREVYDLNSVTATHGGGPIFGVNGVSVVGHGAARADAVQRAIGTAKLAVETELIPKLNEELARVHARVGMQSG
jgi:glycerol-3-phosphate acyltransferase PlsX